MRYDDIFTFDNLLKAHYKSRKGKRHKKEVIVFEENLLVNIENLRRRLLKREYRISSYNEFTIYEPKRREVAALSYEDRIVQHCFCDNFLTPLLDKRLIYDNAACRKGKGTDFARGRLTHFLSAFYRKHKLNGYVLRFDIHHYFDEIDHDVLKRKLRKIISDEVIYDFCAMIIDSFNKDSNKGLPLGNQTSQAFALYYLDEVDRLIKERHRVKCYCRYMDDGVAIHEDRVFLEKLLFDLKNALARLKLSLNEKTAIMPLKNKFSFLGVNYQLHDGGKITKTVNHMKKARIKRYLKANGGNKDTIQSLTAYFLKYNEHFFVLNHLKRRVTEYGSHRK